MYVFTWGFGKLGQLGNGQPDTCHTPVVPKLPGKIKAVGVRNGGHYTAILTTDGVLFTFGCGKHGRLGSGDETDMSTPHRLSVRLKENEVHFREVSCGIWHGAAISHDNNLFIWGFGKSHGVLGDSAIPHMSPPTPLNGPFANKVAGVSCGNNFTLVWTTDGEAYSWGCGRHGALGHKDAEDKHAPTLIVKFKELKMNVRNMNAGFSHCGAISDTGGVFMFGKGEDGALGTGPSPPRQVNEPVQVIEPLQNTIMVEISCSVGEKHGHTLLLSEEGQVFACGDGYKGKLGLGDQVSRFVPTLLAKESFNGEDILHVSAGGIHSAAVSREGHVFTWGCGSDGRLGHPDGKGHRYLFRSDLPRSVDVIASKGKGVEVSCSYYHTAALLQHDK